VPKRFKQDIQSSPSFQIHSVSKQDDYDDEESNISGVEISLSEIELELKQSRILNLIKKETDFHGTYISESPKFESPESAKKWKSAKKSARKGEKQIEELESDAK